MILCVNNYSAVSLKNKLVALDLNTEQQSARNSALIALFFQIDFWLITNLSRKYRAPIIISLQTNNFPSGILLHKTCVKSINLC